MQHWRKIVLFRAITTKLYYKNNLSDVDAGIVTSQADLSCSMTFPQIKIALHDTSFCSNNARYTLLG